MAKRHKIAVLIDNYEPYFRQVTRGVMEFAKLHSWLVLTEFGQEIRPADLIHHDVDGAIASIWNRPGLLEMIRQSGLPAVNVWTGLEYSDLPQVLPDHETAGEMAARELIAHGFTSLGYCGPMPPNPWNARGNIWNGSYFSTQRGRGFVRIAAQHGIVPSLYTDAHILEKHWANLAATAPVGEWLTALPKPCGIMADDDSRTRHIYAHCAARGLLIPEEVAVIGVNNDELMCELLAPPLSSVQLDGVRAGYAAAKLLAALLAGRPRPKNPVLIPPLLLAKRRSSDAYAMADADVAAAVRFIHAQADQPLLVKDVLDEIVVSRRSLQIRFLKTLQRTIRQEICRAHVERAKRLLVETEAPMPVVAEKSGFRTAARLAQVFRREAGVTPTVYRRAHRKSF